MTGVDIKARVQALAEEIHEAGTTENVREAAYGIFVQAVSVYLGDRYAATDAWSAAQSLFENLEGGAINADSEEANKLPHVGQNKLLPDSVVEVYAIYKMRRVTGQYNYVTHEFRITDGLQKTGHYRTPSGACSAVIKELAPGVVPVRKWKEFWKLPDGTQLGRYLEEHSLLAPGK